MTKRTLLFISFLVIISTVPNLVSAIATDYLILEDIGIYKLFTGITGRAFSGPPSKYSQTNTGGILDAAGHFAESDVSYEASYTEPNSKWPFVKVEVTQHSGSDSDKWLLHEVERGFRRGDYEENMTPARFRTIDGSNVFYSGLGGGTYRWMANNIVVSIEYTDLYKQKPEPLEIVKAYIAKFPSTIPAMTVDRAHSETWLKDEMERRLWLGEKWFNQLALQKVEQNAALKEVVKHLDVFLKYREKYFSVAAADERKVIQNLLSQNNAASLKEKLKEYQVWWAEHKAEISIQ